MIGATAQELSCGDCGAVVRERTVFCYNCGSRLSPQSDVEDADAVEAQEATATIHVSEPEAKSALDDLAEKMSRDEAAGARRRTAAAKRKTARVSPRTPKAFTWEPTPDSPRSTILISIIVFAITLGVVALVVIWR